MARLGPRYPYPHVHSPHFETRRCFATAVGPEGLEPPT
jgi:hypothetical protein